MWELRIVSMPISQQLLTFVMGIFPKNLLLPKCSRYWVDISFITFIKLSYYIILCIIDSAIISERTPPI